MSEYQYYEFHAIDCPLSQKEMDELRALSTRAEITPTSFTNTYHWGDFKGGPAALMDRYFDAFVYVANWGTHRLMFRIPRRFLDVEAASAYGDEEVLSLKAKKEHVVLEFLSEDESGDDWTEGEHWMPSLISLRAERMRGTSGLSTWDGSPRSGRTAGMTRTAGLRRMVTTIGLSRPSLPAWGSSRHRCGRRRSSCGSKTS